MNPSTRFFLLAAALLISPLTTSCVQHSSNCKTSAAQAGGADDPHRASPEAAMEALKEGNRRFAGGKAGHNADNLQRVAITAKGQHPVASVIGCADSRTSPEMIFDLGLGELFVCHVAGVASETNDVASLEYGAEHLGIPLIVVMGHTNCGAMKAAIADKPLPGSLPHLIGTIRPAVGRARAMHPNADAATLLSAATREQVLGEVRQLEDSPVLHELIHEGKLKIVGAIYSVENGRVTWL